MQLKVEDNKYTLEALIPIEKECSTQQEALLQGVNKAIGLGVSTLFIEAPEDAYTHEVHTLLELIPNHEY